MRTLAKIGLVELDPSEQAPKADAGEAEPDLEALLAEARAISAGQSESPAGAPAPQPAEALPALPAAALSEGVSFDELYAEANLAPSPFPAEKLLKLLDGLAAMDPPMRKAAVAAMDQADDAWTIEDPLLDASRKVRALSGARARLDQSLAAAEAEAEADLAAQQQFSEQVVSTIREQIAELEATLAEELSKVGEEKVKIQVRLEAARSGRSREAARLDAAIERLQSLYPLFGNPENSPAGKKEP